MVATSKHKVNIFMRFFLIAIYFSPLDGYVKRAAYSSPPRTACSPKRTATLQAIVKDDYLAKLKQAGFSVDVISEANEISETQYNELPIESIKIDSKALVFYYLE